MWGIMDSVSLLWACGGAALGGGVSWLLAQLILQKRYSGLQAENYHLSEAAEHYRQGTDLKNNGTNTAQKLQNISQGKSCFVSENSKHRRTMPRS